MTEKDALNRATALIRKGLSTDLDAEALTFLRKGCEMLEGLGLLEVAEPTPRPRPKTPTPNDWADIFGNRVSEEDLYRETTSTGTTTSTGNWSFTTRRYP